jgi:hypothetical protein
MDAWLRVCVRVCVCRCDPEHRLCYDFDAIEQYLDTQEVGFLWLPRLDLDPSRTDRACMRCAVVSSCLKPLPSPPPCLVLGLCVRACVLQVREALGVKKRGDWQACRPLVELVRHVTSRQTP